MKTPCSDPTSNPDDWYLSRDGKQYPDDALIFNTGSLIADARANHDDRPEDEILADAEADALKDALRRRRHAKDKCHTECYFRTQCLDRALENVTPATHGTWGGYYEEELREIRREVARRKRARHRA